MQLIEKNNNEKNVANHIVDSFVKHYKPTEDKWDKETKESHVTIYSDIVEEYVIDEHLANYVIAQLIQESKFIPQPVEFKKMLTGKNAIIAEGGKKFKAEYLHKWYMDNRGEPVANNSQMRKYPCVQNLLLEAEECDEAACVPSYFYKLVESYGLEKRKGKSFRVKTSALDDDGSFNINFDKIAKNKDLNNDFINYICDYLNGQNKTNYIKEIKEFTGVKRLALLGMWGSVELEKIRIGIMNSYDIPMDYYQAYPKVNKNLETSRYPMMQYTSADKEAYKDSFMWWCITNGNSTHMHMQRLSPYRINNAWQGCNVEWLKQIFKYWENAPFGRYNNPYPKSSKEYQHRRFINGMIKAKEVIPDWNVGKLFKSKQDMQWFAENVSETFLDWFFQTMNARNKGAAA